MLGVLGLFALANSFTMRVCLSMTITQMVVQSQSSEHIIGETCPDPSLNSTTEVAESISNETMIIHRVSIVFKIINLLDYSK